MSSGFFVASLIHVPAGPSSVHLVLIGLMGLVLGWTCFPAMLIALLLQSLLFQFGGLTVLGVNTVNHAVPAVIMYVLLGGLARRGGKLAAAAGAAAGAGGVVLAATMTAFSLIFSGEQFTVAAKLMLAAHLPVAAVEGVI
jgi:cobalt/nickel transport system permease protein